MAKKISELTTITSLAGTEYIPVVQTVGGADDPKKITTANARTYLGAGAAQAEWRADTHAGYGGTDTRIPYFTNVRSNVDTAGAMTVVNDSTSGCKITINTADYYTVSYNFSPTSASYIGLSINSAQLTTGIDAISVANRLALSYIPATHTDQICVRVWLAVNDVIRPHSGAITPDTAAFANFSITRG